MVIRRGDIILTDFAPAREAEVNYERPAIVVSNNSLNAFAPVVMVVPLTSSIEKIYASELYISSGKSHLDRDSKAQVQLMRHVTIKRFKKQLSYLSEETMLELDQKLNELLAL